MPILPPHSTCRPSQTRRRVVRASSAGLTLLFLAGCAEYESPPSAPVVYAPAAPPVAYAPAPEGPVDAPDVAVTVSSDADFYEPLSPYGDWIEVGSYGRCWRPRNIAADWRPYTNGHWEWTDEGWYWVSDEPWGWATCHYGRWDQDDGGRWFWVPRTEWAPAWVEWREGDGYVGWAPAPPAARGVEIDIRVRPQRFVFVPERRMTDPVRPNTVIVNNTTIINQTVNITNVRTINRTVINAGPRAETIEQHSGRRFTPVPARQVRAREEAKAPVHLRASSVASHPAATPAGSAPHGRTAVPATRSRPATAPAAPVATSPAHVQPASRPENRRRAPAVVTTPRPETHAAPINSQPAHRPSQPPPAYTHATPAPQPPAAPHVQRHEPVATPTAPHASVATRPAPRETQPSTQPVHHASPAEHAAAPRTGEPPRTVPPVQHAPAKKAPPPHRPGEREDEKKDEKTPDQRGQ